MMNAIFASDSNSLLLYTQESMRILASDLSKNCCIVLLFKWKRNTEQNSNFLLDEKKWRGEQATNKNTISIIKFKCRAYISLYLYFFLNFIALMFYLSVLLFLCSHILRQTTNSYLLGNDLIYF